jgi:large subunit ribosomal protein L29
MDVRDIRKMDDKQLADALEDQKEAMFNFRLQDASGQLEDPNAIKRARRDIARLKTVIRERELAAQAVAKKDGK